MFSLSLGRILRVWSTFWAHVQLINATEFPILSLFCCLAGKCFIVVLPFPTPSPYPSSCLPCCMRASAPCKRGSHDSASIPIFLCFWLHKMLICRPRNCIQRAHRVFQFMPRAVAAAAATAAIPCWPDPKPISIPVASRPSCVAHLLLRAAWPHCHAEMQLLLPLPLPLSLPLSKSLPLPLPRLRLRVPALYLFFYFAIFLFK